jgi:hypothetical protein
VVWKVQSPDVTEGGQHDSEHRKKTSMSVHGNGSKLLGIKKTDAYWLIKKKPF